MEAKRLEDLNAAASAEGADDETKARYDTTRHDTTCDRNEGAVVVSLSPVGFGCLLACIPYSRSSKQAACFLFAGDDRSEKSSFSPPLCAYLVLLSRWR